MSFPFSRISAPVDDVVVTLFLAAVFHEVWQLNHVHSGVSIGGREQYKRVWGREDLRTKSQEAEAFSRERKNV